jgi:hypothetical protein
LTLNDVNGVDATVRDGGVSTDWQLKGTSSPDWSADKKTLFFDLDVRTYKLFIGDRNSSGYLGVVVVPDDDADWAAVSDKELRLRHCGYGRRSPDCLQRRTPRRRVSTCPSRRNST